MPNALEKKAYRHIDIHVVREVAEYLMLTNLETTTLEVKDALRFAGYIAYQADVSHMMDVIAKRNPGWQYTCNGVFRHYTFKQYFDFQLTPQVPKYSLN